MADVITGDTELGATKQDLIASLVQRELEAKAKIFPTITDVSQFAVKGAQSISFPKLTSFSVINRASGAAGDAAALTASVDQLDLDQRAYVAWLIDSADAVQTTIDSQMEFAKRAASAHGRNVDTQIITELETVGVATTTAGTITKEIILEMRESLLVNEANIDTMSLLIGPDSESAMLAINEFVRADAYGRSNIPSGVIGFVYGVQILVSTLVGASTYYMYDKEGCAIGFQQGPQMSNQKANEYGANAERWAMDQLFGVKGMHLGEKGVGATQSALVVKDNN